MASINIYLYKKDGTAMRFNAGWIESISTLAQSSSTPETIQYGSLANSGSITINDLDGTIQQAIANGEIDYSNVELDIYIGDKKIASHITSNSDYDEISMKLTIQLTGKMSNWDKMTYMGYNYQGEDNAFTLLYDVLGTTHGLGYSDTDIDNMLSNNIVFGTGVIMTIKAYLQAITIKYPYLETDTFRNTINKFCDLAQLQVYEDENGKPKFVSARPVYIETSKVVEKDNAFLIPESFKRENLTKSIFLKNKYDGIDSKIKKTSEITDYDALSYTYNNVIDYGKEDVDIKSTDFSNNNYNNGHSVYSYTIKTKSSSSGSTFVSQITNTNRVGIYLHYKTFSLTIPRKSNYNLDKIIRLYDGVDAQSKPNISYTIDYRKYTGLSACKDTTLQDVPESSWETSITLNEDKSNYETGSGNLETSFKYTGVNASADIKSSSTVFNDCTVTADDLSTNKNTGLFTYDDDNVTLTLSLLVSKEELTSPLQEDYTVETKTSGATATYDDFYWYYGKYYKYIAHSITISFYGDKFTISLEDEDNSTDNINTATTTISLNSNELMQDNAIILNNYIKDTIKDDILSDYSNGVSNGDIDLFVGKLSSKNDSISYNDGGILKTGNLIYFADDTYSDGSQRYWRIKGLTFKYQNGEPQKVLELQEAIKIEGTKVKVKFFAPAVLVKNGNTILNYNYTGWNEVDVEIGTELTVTNNKYYGNDNTNKVYLLSLTANGSQITNNKIIITGATNISADYITEIPIEVTYNPTSTYLPDDSTGSVTIEYNPNAYSFRYDIQPNNRHLFMEIIYKSEADSYAFSIPYQADGISSTSVKNRVSGIYSTFNVAFTNTSITISNLISDEDENQTTHDDNYILYGAKITYVQKLCGRDRKHYIDDTQQS